MHAEKPTGCLLDAALKLSPADVPISEKELPAEVAFLNDVIIRHSYQALVPASDAHHGKILQKLTCRLFEHTWRKKAARQGCSYNCLSQQA
jgi:hypothetical protein